MLEPNKASLFPCVEVQAMADDMIVRLHADDAHDWSLEVKFTGPGPLCGQTRNTRLTAKQAGAMMALFIAADGMEELEQALYDAVGSLGECVEEFSPIP